MSDQQPPGNVPRLDLTPYRGEWIALNPKTQQVVSHATSIRDAEQAALESGVTKPLLFSVPESDAFFIGLR